jgi:hypothetical protein
VLPGLRRSGLLAAAGPLEGMLLDCVPLERVTVAGMTLDEQVPDTVRSANHRSPRHPERRRLGLAGRYRYFRARRSAALEQGGEAAHREPHTHESTMWLQGALAQRSP